MNQYEPDEQTYIPPGWDEWFAAGHDYYEYVLNENGRHVRYGSRPEDYLTDVIARHTVSAIRRASESGRPFFFFVTPYAPHGPATAAPPHARSEERRVGQEWFSTCRSRCGPCI